MSVRRHCRGFDLCALPYLPVADQEESEGFLSEATDQSLWRGLS